MLQKCKYMQSEQILLYSCTIVDPFCRLLMGEMKSSAPPYGNKQKVILVTSIHRIITHHTTCISQQAASPQCTAQTSLNPLGQPVPNKVFIEHVYMDSNHSFKYNYCKACNCSHLSD